MPEDDTAPGGLPGLEDIDRVVHEPGRLVILAILSVARTADFAYLMHRTGLTKGNLSSHLGRLEAAGYVSVRKEFAGKIPRTLVQLTERGREAIEAYRRGMFRVLEGLPDSSDGSG
jgi:DNA-binding MarR family transcriptional regulator